MKIIILIITANIHDAPAAIIVFATNDPVESLGY